MTRETINGGGDGTFVQRAGRRELARREAKTCSRAGLQVSVPMYVSLHLHMVDVSREVRRSRSLVKMLLDQVLGQHRTVTPGLGHTPQPAASASQSGRDGQEGVVGCLIRNGAIPEMWGPSMKACHAARSRRRSRARRLRLRLLGVATTRVQH